MVHARTSSGPAVKKYSSWSAAYPALMIFAKALKKRKGEGIQFIQHIHIKQLDAPSNQFTWKDITYFEDIRSTFEQSNNCSSLLLWPLLKRSSFLLQNNKDRILICLFGNLQKHGININHAALLSHAIFRTPGHESVSVWLKFNIETIYYSSSENYGKIFSTVLIPHRWRNSFGDLSFSKIYITNTYVIIKTLYRDDRWQLKT